MVNFPPYSSQHNGNEYVPNLASIAEFLMSNGWSKAAAVGTASTIGGEGGGNPESVGSGGGGIIGWTPISSARPNPNIITGNPQQDFDTQLQDLLVYAQSNSPEAVARGGVNLQTLMNATDANQAATWWSEFEGPAQPGSDLRTNLISEINGMVGNYQPNSAYTVNPATLTATNNPGTGGQTCIGFQLPGWLGGQCLGQTVPSIGSIEHTVFQYLERFGLFVLGGIFILVGLWMMLKDSGPGKAASSQAKQQGASFLGGSGAGAAEESGGIAAEAAEVAPVAAVA